MTENALAEWMKRRKGSRKEDQVVKLAKQKHSSDEKLVWDNF